MNDKIEELKNKNTKRSLISPHYYGDTTRQIYLFMALIMLIATPFYYNKLPISAPVSVFSILILATIAGLTNPKLRSVIVFDFLVSIFMFLAFGWEAISSYKVSADMFFFTNLILSILSLFALYLSSKTLRGKFTSS